MQTQSQTDICNLALMRLGMRKIQSITDQSDANAIACNVGWLQALGEVAREQPWNCLKHRAYLGQLAPNQNPAPQWPWPIPSTATQWTPGANYAVNAYVLFANYLYQCLIANTASVNFTNDLTKGYWFQTNYFSPNYLGQTPGNAGPMFEWRYAYELPGDFVLLIELNGQSCWRGNYHNGSLYEIYQKALYCNTGYADIKYCKLETDTTNYDPLFTGALVLNLACIIATSLRKDEGQLSVTLRQEYKDYLSEARAKDGSEGKPRRYNIVSQSRFVRSRYRSTNG